MNQPPYAELQDLLDREAALQRETIAVLDAQLDAARTRRLDALETTIQQLADVETRARSLGVERDALLLRCGATTSRRALTAITATPGAPAAALRARAGELRALAETASARARRLQPLLRELQNVYSGALAAILHGLRDAASGALVQTEA